MGIKNKHKPQGEKKMKRFARVTRGRALYELLQSINQTDSHAVLLHDEDGWYVERHVGAAQDCTCNDHNDFFWREEGHTEPEALLDELV